MDEARGYGVGLTIFAAIESLWDAATGITAFARAIPFADARFELELAAGDVLKLAA